MRRSLFALPLLLAVAGGCSNHDTGPTPSASESTAETPPPAEPVPRAGQPVSGTPAAPPPETAGAVPEAFRGRYARDAAACARAGDESRLSIEANRIAFHESSGAIIGVTGDGGEAAITARLSGEGETWERTYRFRLADGGRSIIDAEGGMRRVRCNAAG